MITIKKLWYIFSYREKLRGMILIAGMFFGAGFEALGVGLIVPFIAIINEPELAFDSPYVRPLLSVLQIGEPSHLFIGAGVAMFLIYAIRSCYLTYLYHSLYGFVFDKQVNLSRHLFAGYLTAPYAFHLRRNTAELVKNTTETIHRFASGFMIALILTFSEVLVVAALLLLLVIVAPKATLAALVLLAVPTTLFYGIVRHRLGNSGRVREHSLTAMLQWINQGLGGIKETKLMHCTGFFLDRHAHHARQFADASRIYIFLTQLPRFIIELIVAGGIVAVVVVILAGGKDLKSIVPLLGMFAAAALRLTPSLSRIVAGLGSLRFHFAAADVIYQELWDDRGRCEASETQMPRPSSPDRSRFQRSLVVEGLSYRYSDGDDLVISDISLEIPKGHCVAFVGATGSGKTTLADLILGLLRPTEGRILVDGRDILEDLSVWQHNIGYIPQEVYLTDDSIRRNIAFALPDHEIDDSRVWQALRAAQIEDLVRALPEELDTRIHERGVRLSGGECQRLGIARALYRDPEVLVLDEATASLDHNTETAIVRTLERLRGKKTIIIIAHKITVVRNCDCLYLISKGRVQACGPYSDLIEADHDFRMLAGMRK